MNPLTEKQKDFLRAAARGNASPWDHGSSVVSAMKKAGYVLGRKVARAINYEITNAGRAALHGTVGAVFFLFEDGDGRRVAGPVQGCGGFVHSEAFMEATRDVAARGESLALVYEPRPGHVRVYPEYSPQGNGPGVDVPASNYRGLAP